MCPGDIFYFKTIAPIPHHIQLLKIPTVSKLFCQEMWAGNGEASVKKNKSKKPLGYAELGTLAHSLDTGQGL